MTIIGADGSINGAGEELLHIQGWGEGLMLPELYRCSFPTKNTTSKIRYWILLKISARSHGVSIKYDQMSLKSDLDYFYENMFTGLGLRVGF